MAATGRSPINWRCALREPATRSPRSLTARPCWICAPRFPRRQTGRRKRRLRILSVDSALIGARLTDFSHHVTDARRAGDRPDSSPLLAGLLEGGHRLSPPVWQGAFLNNGRDAVADEIVKTMTAAGYSDGDRPLPGSSRPRASGSRTSPYVNRMRLSWQKMREPVIARFPRAPGLPANAHSYTRGVDEAYVTDAYHSLSIEGYCVLPDLIERVRRGTWDPDGNEQDREQRDAMAARGISGFFMPCSRASPESSRARIPGRSHERTTGRGTRDVRAERDRRPAQAS